MPHIYPRGAMAAALLLLSAVFLGTPAPSRAAEAGLETAIFAGGCFWCVESDFDKVPGVVETVSGYTGSAFKDPTYKDVSAGGTGHREAVKIVYDPKRVSYERLLHVFWRSIDPTDPGGQFCDRGDSYGTAIFVTNQMQRETAESSKAELQSSGVLGKPIVTPIETAGIFYPAEQYHQDYYNINPVRYWFYRNNCGRDRRLRALWGAQALDGIFHS